MAITESAKPGSLSSHWAERIGLGALCLFACCLPFQGIGKLWIVDFTGHHHPSDWIAALGVPALVVVVWRHRRALLASRLVLAWAAFNAAKIAGGAFAAEPRLELSSMVRYAVSVLLVAAVAVLATEAQRRRTLVRWFVGGGIVATALALAGFAFMVASGRLGEGIQPFAYVGHHPVFDRLPRLAGTFGHSPQHMGEYLVVLLAFAACGAQGAADLWGRRMGRLVVVAVGLALALTFSFAWMGALVVVVGFLALRRPRPRWARMLAVGGALCALFASSWIVNVGLPVSDPASLVRGYRPCAEVDVDHQVSYVTPDKPPRCMPLYISWPYAAPLTPYLDAKERALDQFLARPWFGTGEAQYATAIRRALGPTANGLERTDYDSPHCAYLGALATSGLFGGLGFLVLVGMVLSIGMRTAAGAAASDHDWLGPWLAVVALLCIGVNLDIVAQRQLWLALGLLGASGMKAADTERVASVPATH